MYSLVKNVVKAMPNFTINDVLDTDYDLLMGLLTESKTEEQEVVGLDEFIRNM